MPPVFGPWIVVEGALVVLRRRQWDRGLAVAQREERGFSPTRNSSITTSAPASPRPPPNIMSIAAFGLGDRLGDDHALAGREPVGLDHDRCFCLRA
jgi:hypothetical protein